MYTLEKLIYLPAYSKIAREYYDTHLHPTCEAFDIASRWLIFHALDLLQFDEKFHFCDVGAGRSVLADYIARREKSFSRLCLVDESAEMLQWSRADLAAEFHVNSATSIAEIGTFDLIVSSLGDPYNTEKFWAAAYKALNRGGQILFSTPSIEWADRFRSSTPNEYEDAAFFTLGDGSKVYVPSYIKPTSEQSIVIEQAGLTLRSVSKFTIAQLSHIPPKLTDLSSNLPVVTLYHASRSS